MGERACFSEGGSLSLNQIKKLSQGVEKKWAEKTKKGKIKVKNLEAIKTQRRCLRLWRTEAERREKGCNEGTGRM